MIQVKNLTKSFGETKAVDGLTFTVNTGEIVGFLGPNGAGKTTTMRLLTGFLSPDSGVININDQTPDDNLHHIQTQIGYLPENNPLYKDMLVSEMLSMAADLKAIPAKSRKEAFDFAVSAVSIDDVFYRPIGELSKGYKQRVGMAIALLHKPNILIMDEPTEGLDPNQRTEIRALIKDLAKERTIIISTHVMQEATALSNRILIINKGRLVADGNPDELTQGSKDERILELEVEGAKIASTLKTLKDIKSVSTEKIKGNRYKVSIVSDAQKPFQPILSSLIGKHNWTLWSLQEKRQNLEDVFQQLTS